MFGRMMNNYYYGKSGKGDFRKDDLPETRMQLFRDTLRTRLSGLCRLSMMYALVWIPAMVVILIYSGSMYSNLSLAAIVKENDYASYVQMAQDAKQEVNVTEEDYNKLREAEFDVRGYLNQNLFTMLLILFPCIAITGPCTAGISYVTRNWARDEHAFIWTDFRDAVKANWKIPLLLSTITGALPVLVYVGWTTYGQMAENNAIMLIPRMLVLLVGIIWSLAVTYMHPLTITYDLKAMGVLRNGMLLGIARLPFSVGIRLLHCVPALIAAGAVWFFGLDPVMALVLIGAYYIIIGFGLSRFVTASYTNAVFDRFINPQIEGAKVNQGLREKDDDEDEDAEDEEGGTEEETAEKTEE
jgi:uncharacterized membrane protein YesL